MTRRNLEVYPGADLGILRGLGVGGGGGSWPEFFKGRGVRVQVRRNFHILTSTKKTSGGLNPYPPPPGSATAIPCVSMYTWYIRHVINQSSGFYS